MQAVARLAVASVLFASVALATVAASASGATACPASIPDGFGPFGKGMPPVRAKIGTGHVLTGVVLSSLDCKPIRRARVELWQANKQGRYVRAGSATVYTNAQGRFRLEGPLPPSYEGRPGHIHLRVSAPGHEQLLSRYEAASGARRGTVRLVLQIQDL
jgi:protocatechuate 3,4-dioxygenase beta subunit